MSLSFAVVCEARADAETACTLADRVVCDEVDWIDESLLPHLRRWRGQDVNEPQLSWKHVPDLARQSGLRLFGHFDDQPGAFDAFVARQALTMLKLSGAAPDAVLLIRDADDQPERRGGLEQAKALGILHVPVVIGFAQTKRECWALAGFEPATDEERSRLDDLRQELGFYPCVHAERLTAKDDGAKRSAKRVLAILCKRERDRELACLDRAPLALLAERGRNTGLADFLDAVRQDLVPLFLRPGGAT